MLFLGSRLVRIGRSPNWGENVGKQVEFANSMMGMALHPSLVLGDAN